MLLRFVTSIWNKPDGLACRIAVKLPGRLGMAARSFLAKRSHPGLQVDLVEQRWMSELVRVLADGATLGRYRHLLLFLHKGVYDWAVARRVAVLKPDVVVGYEISCARTFASAKRIGAVTVLDLAGLHHDFTAAIAGRYGVGGGSSRLDDRLRARKQRELMLADHILTISQLASDTLVAHGIERERISVVPLGVSLGTFQPKSNYRQSGPFRVLFVGNLSLAKGVDKLLEAFRELALPDAELVLVGSHAERTFLEGYEGLYSHIPYLAHSELAAEYQRADVFVLPTLFDSWGLVVTEAMACGTPVIITENCGAKEVVSPDRGWVVAAGDVEALKSAIWSAYENRQQLAQMGRNARAGVEGLDWDGYHKAVAERVSAVWSQAVAHRGGGEMASPARSITT